jgi:16S rRNA (cytosine967-C5)-methyltransferase
MIAPARLAAYEALRQIEDGRATLGEAMAGSHDALKDERDRSLVLEVVAGTERMRAALDFQLAARLSRPIGKLDAAVLRVLRFSAFQLIYLSRLPASAVINDAVNITRSVGKSSAGGLVNAVLRTLAKDRDALAWPDPANVLAYLSTRHSHPEWLVARWIARHGVEATEKWLVFNNDTPQMCLAPNRRLVNRDALAEELRAHEVELEPTALAPYGLRVTGGRPLGTRAFREGRFVVQDEASQLICGLVPALRGKRVLDLCASPGGKTVSLAADVGQNGLVVACDLRPHRLRILAKTLSRCRVPRAPIVHVPAEGDLPFRPASFHCVLIDAPCSGLGTLRRDPDIRWKRSPEDLARFAITQRGLLDRAAPLVSPGGAMVYSTCSSEPEENQDVVAGFLQDHPEYREERVHQTLPFREGLEAFFGAVLTRKP